MGSLQMADRRVGSAGERKERLGTRGQGPSIYLSIYPRPGVARKVRPLPRACLPNTALRLGRLGPLMLLLLAPSLLGRPAPKPLDMVPQVLAEAGVPTQVVGETASQDMAAVVDTTEYMCGSKEMDEYFDEHSGGATDRLRKRWSVGSHAPHAAPHATRVP